jgi:hypothetical protein
MSDDQIRKEVLRFLRGNSPASTRDVRRAVTARGARVDEAIRALLSEGRVMWTDAGWHALRSDGTRYGHATGKSRGAGGAQVSYRKAVAHMASYLLLLDPDMFGIDDAFEAAEGVLAEALSDKQRERLDRSIGTGDG